MNDSDLNEKVQVELYKSAICPRCMYVAKVLRDIQKKHPQIEIEAIDIATNMGRMRRAGVVVFPAIKIGSKQKAWYVPDNREIWDFVESAILK